LLKNILIQIFVWFQNKLSESSHKKIDRRNTKKYINIYDLIFFNSQKLWYPQNAFLFNLIASFLPENFTTEIFFCYVQHRTCFTSLFHIYYAIPHNILHKCTHKIVHFKMNKTKNRNKHLCGLLFILLFVVLLQPAKKWEMNCFGKQFTPSIFNWNSFISPPINWQHCRRISSSSQHHIFIFKFYVYSKSKCIEFAASSFSCLFVFLLHWIFCFIFFSRLKGAVINCRGNPQKIFEQKLIFYVFISQKMEIICKKCVLWVLQ